MKNRGRSRNSLPMVMGAAILIWAMVCSAVLLSTMFLGDFPRPLRKFVIMDRRNSAAMLIAAILVWVLLGSSILIWVNRYPPRLSDFIEKLMNLLDPYVDITFDEFTGKWAAPR